MNALLIGFLSLTVILGAMVGVFLYFTPTPETITAERPEKLEQAVRVGDFEAAFSENALIQNNPSKSSTEKALATYALLGAEYRLTGDVNERLLDIQKMKAIILDQTVALGIRVNVLNLLAGQYAVPGTNPEVFAEVYKDSPFSQYLVPMDDFDASSRLSAHQLFEWSYSLLPTSYAAISIARWYADQNILNSELPPSTVGEYTRMAEDYLNKADEASLQEAQRDPMYYKSTRYLLYRYWRTFVIARLATQKGEPYVNQYRVAYEDFIGFVGPLRSALAGEYLAFARYSFAGNLDFFDDRATAKEQLDSLAQQLNAITDPGTNAFVAYLRKYINLPTSVFGELLREMFAISPDFKAAVEKVTIPAPN